MTEQKPSAAGSAVHGGYIAVARRRDARRTARRTATRTGGFTTKQRGRSRGFTLAELLVTVGVLVVLMLLFTQLLNSAANITTLAHKRMDGDSQARELLDRMAIDVTQMVKRSDVYYHLKASTTPADCPAGECGTQPGNDEIAFYSNVPGYMHRTPRGRSGARCHSSDTGSIRARQRLVTNSSDWAPA